MYEATNLIRSTNDVILIGFRRSSLGVSMRPRSPSSETAGSAKMVHPNFECASLARQCLPNLPAYSARSVLPPSYPALHIS